MDIYPASKIFILEIIAAVWKYCKWVVILKNFHLKQISGNPQNFISLKICHPTVNLAYYNNVNKNVCKK